MTRKRQNEKRERTGQGIEYEMVFADISLFVNVSTVLFYSLVSIIPVELNHRGWKSFAYVVLAIFATWYTWNILPWYMGPPTIMPSHILAITCKQVYPHDISLKCIESAGDFLLIFISPDHLTSERYVWKIIQGNVQHSNYTFNRYSFRCRIFHFVWHWQMRTCIETYAGWIPNLPAENTSSLYGAQRHVDKIIIKTFRLSSLKNHFPPSL